MSCQHDQQSYQSLCERVLKDSGARITKPRLAVIHCLEKAKKALSAREILEQIQSSKQQLAIDKVSIYRILSTLLEHQLVHQVAPDGSYIACSHIDCSAALHLLTRCRNCGVTREQEVPQEILAPMQWFMKKELRFEPREHFLQIEGICSDCQKS